jgi:hypothetical protein
MIPPDINRPQNIDVGGVSPTPSKVDTVTGRHTIPFVVALLFVITLMVFLIIYLTKDNLPEGIVTSFFSLLGVLAGFFVGTSAANKS